MTAPSPRAPRLYWPQALQQAWGVGLALWLGFGLLVQAAELPSEDDFFDSVPAVLTVTRLSQSLADTPGAHTVIDRETIARSGARDLTDLLRLEDLERIEVLWGSNTCVLASLPERDAMAGLLCQ